MAYTKQNFEDGQVLTAEHLNKMEQGIAAPDWEQMVNRPFGDTVTEVLPETEFVCVDDGTGAYAAECSLVGLSGGETLLIKFDGTEYTCPLLMESGGMFLYGNGALLGMDDNGVPFAVAAMPSMNTAMLAMFDGNPHTVGISAVVSQKIDSKYIPEFPKLYVIDDNANTGYLYVDVACTTKATMVDVPDSIYFSIGVSNSHVVLFWEQPNSVVSDFYGQTVGYKQVSLVSGGSAKDYRTAEYTPPTT